MTPTLRTRLAVGSTVVFGLLVGGVSIVTYQVLAGWLDDDVTVRVEELARGLHGLLRLDGDRASVRVAPEDDEQAAFVREATQYYQVYDAASGRLLAESPGIAALGLQLTPPEVAALRARPAPFDVETDFGRFRIASSNGVTEDGRAYLMQVGQALRPLDSALARYRTLLWWRLPALVAAGGLVFWSFAGYALRPLAQVAAATESVDIANLGARLPVRGAGDELDLVAESFNRTLARLDQSVGDMRQFSTALAHELRTPLAGLRGQIELAMRTPDITPGLRELFAGQIEEVDRLTHLINHVLTLARAESGQIRLTVTRVDLGQLVAGIVEQLEIVADAAGIALRFEQRGAAVFTDGDAAWLERIVLNLVDNAIKYSNPPGSVVVTVEGDRDLARITVQDTGVGLSPDDARRVFDRFFRVDPARPQSSDGAGLGLSLVQWVATVHGGSVTVASTLGKGSTFTVTLPASGRGERARALTPGPPSAARS